MIRRGQTTAFPERLDITEQAAAGQSDPESAAALSGARSGQCANGVAEVNTKGAAVSTPRWAALPPGRSVPFRQESAMPSCTCARRIPVGGSLPDPLSLSRVWYCAYD